MTFGKTFWAGLLASITAGLIILGLIVLIINISVGNLMEKEKLKVEKNTVLHMELNGSIGDYSYSSFDPGTVQMNNQLGLIDIIDGIKIAQDDDKIKGIFLNCDNISAGFANIKEIRDALAEFQNSGKFIVSYHENYDKRGYYLSSVAEELYVFPSGMFEFLGLGTELMFFKGALEKLDVEMQVIRGSNNKFKSFVEPYIYDHMSEENRLQTEKYLNALWGEIVNAVSESRGLTSKKLNEIADNVSIRQSGDAVDYGMADGTKYYDEVLDILREKAGTEENEELELLSFRKYALKKTEDQKNLNKLKKKNIALIFAEGEIVEGNGSVNQIGGTSLSEDIRDAREDEDIKAIVLRVNSPGGSALASDIIWREVMLTKEVKPVIVSMGDVAASGGYYIACGADMIFAQPNTITGSIGVFGIIPYTGAMFENKLGITFDRVQTNDHSVLSLNRKLDTTELAIIQGGVDAIYDDFISKVSEGRGMKKSDVDSIGQGRVWAGKDAINIGLVDKFGGLYDAIAEAADRAGVESDGIKLKIYPEKKTSTLSVIMENLAEEEMQLSPQSQMERQLMDIYSYFQLLGNTKGVQARLPYLYWIY